MNERESPPFPFLPGTVVRLKTESGYKYYKTVGQAQQAVLTAPYLIRPNEPSTGLHFNENRYKYYRRVGQAQQAVLSSPNLIRPNESNTGLSFNIGKVNAFQTSSSLLKQWVTWVDNEYLGVQWTINGTTFPLVNGIPQYLTIQNSPKYDYSIQFYSVASLNIEATYNLINLNPHLPIRGVLTVVVATSTVQSIQEPKDSQPFIDISIGGTSVAGV